MAEDKEIQNAHRVAVQALERMEKENLMPSPTNFELWYRYYDQDSEIVGAIDKTKGSFDEGSCAKLYKRYLSNSNHEDAVRNISDQVHQAISEISTVFRTVKTATSQYGQSLDGVSHKLANAEDVKDIGEIVTALVNDTKQMVAHNRDLETQLSTSSNQVQELRKNLDTVRKEAMTDGLTGLANRKSFDKHLRNSILDASDEGTALTLLMLDIDHFKNFNDNYGHQIGDQVLRLVARTLIDGVKGRDLAARYGGEEFSIILPATSLQAGVAVANSLRRAVESKEVVNRTTEETLGRITLSIGVAQLEEDERLVDLIERADAALYTAKHNGRNQVAAAPAEGTGDEAAAS